MRDLDFRWLLDCLIEGNFERFPRYLPTHLLETGLDILAHIASRFVSPKPFLERGVELLYSHFLHSGGSYSEDVILRNFEVKIVSCSSSSCDEKDTHCPFAHFHGREGVKLICVRWVEALSLVASREAVLDSGLAYVRPRDASKLMADRFALKVKAWSKYDFYNITSPYCEKHFYALPKGTPSHVVKDTRRLNDEVLLRYLSSMTAVRKDPAENAKLRPVYEQLGQRLGLRAPASREHSISNLGDDFMAYAPPCIANPVRKHAAQKTHHKFEERFELFNFCYNAGVSLEAAQRLWDELIDNDVHTTENKHTLKLLAKGHYDTCKSKNYKGMGCAKMTGCTFIEGGARNTLACKAYCGAPDIEDMFWSPLKAASYLVKRLDSPVCVVSSE